MDIVERLRDTTDIKADTPPIDVLVILTLHEAADEIERQRYLISHNEPRPWADPVC